jgi:hypothetical protein
MSPSVTPKHFLGPEPREVAVRGRRAAPPGSAGGCGNGGRNRVAMQQPGRSGDPGAEDGPEAGVAAAPAEAPSPASHWPQLVGAQYTFVRQHQTGLTSPYEGPRSLDPTGDTQSSHTMGVYLGWAVFDRLQLYVDAEKFMGAGVSGAQGLGGLPKAMSFAGSAQSSEALLHRPQIRSLFDSAALRRDQDRRARPGPTPLELSRPRAWSSRRVFWRPATISTRTAMRTPHALSS